MGVLQYAGLVGVFTGMRPGKYGISMNQRYDGTLFENLMEALFVPGVRPVSWMIREVLDSDGACRDLHSRFTRRATQFFSLFAAKTYPAAVVSLHTTPIPAPCYLAVSGVQPGEGVIISRWRNGGDLWHLNLPENRWFLPQTNDDHWLPPKDGRRAAAIASMNAIGQQNISLDGLFTVLSTPPVFNVNLVTYTTLMSAATGNYTTFVRMMQ